VTSHIHSTSNSSFPKQRPQQHLPSCTIPTLCPHVSDIPFLPFPSFLPSPDTAHPGLGKGGFGNIQISGDANATADANKQITISKDKEQDLSKCDCKDDCKTDTRKVKTIVPTCGLS
jgi:hypothetical protein